MNTSSSRIRPHPGLVELGVAAALVAAGIAHLLLTPEHLAESACSAPASRLRASFSSALRH